MYIYDTNFLNFPVIRFKKPKIETLGAFYEQVERQEKKKIRKKESIEQQIH